MEVETTLEWFYFADKALEITQKVKDFLPIIELRKKLVK